VNTNGNAGKLKRRRCLKHYKNAFELLQKFSWTRRTNYAYSSFCCLIVESRENPALPQKMHENATLVLKTLCWNAGMNALPIAPVEAFASFWRPSKQHWWYYFKCVLIYDVSWCVLALCTTFWRFKVRSWTLHCHLVFHRFKCVLIDDVSSLMTKMSEVALDFVTKIKSRHISFLQCMHGKETSTHEMRNCWAGDDAGYQNLRMIKSASKKPNTDN
jgi:hypothetical protein